MTKTKKSVERVEDLKAQVGDLLGVNIMMSEDVIKVMRETLIDQAKNNGEEHIEEVIDTIEKALDKVKKPVFKAIIATNILVKCPMGMQKCFLEEHTKLLRNEMTAHMRNQIGDNPFIHLALLAATLES